jgi:hypothetical protein
MWRNHIIKAEGILALSERVKQTAKRTRNREVASDLRLAVLYLRRLASILIADEAKVEGNPKRKQELETEATKLTDLDL